MTTTKIFIEGIWEKRKSGFFFKGEFVAKNKRKAINKLREQFRNYNDTEKLRFADEWKVITYEYEKGRAIIEKIRIASEKTRELKKIQTPEYKKAIDKIKWLNKKKQYDDFLTRVLAQINNNKTNYNFVNTRLNKIEENVNAILKRLQVEA